MVFTLVVLRGDGRSTVRFPVEVTVEVSREETPSIIIISDLAVTVTTPITCTISNLTASEDSDITNIPVAAAQTVIRESAECPLRAGWPIASDSRGVLPWVESIVGRSGVVEILEVETSLEKAVCFCLHPRIRHGSCSDFSNLTYCHSFHRPRFFIPYLPLLGIGIEYGRHHLDSLVLRHASVASFRPISGCQAWILEPCYLYVELVRRGMLMLSGDPARIWEGCV